MLITNDGLRRGDKHVPLKDISDQALKTSPQWKMLLFVSEPTEISTGKKDAIFGGIISLGMHLAIMKR